MHIEWYWAKRGRFMHIETYLRHIGRKEIRLTKNMVLLFLNANIILYIQTLCSTYCLINYASFWTKGIRTNFILDFWCRFNLGSRTRIALLFLNHVGNLCLKSQYVNSIIIKYYGIYIIHIWQQKHHFFYILSISIPSIRLQSKYFHVPTYSNYLKLLFNE